MSALKLVHRAQQAAAEDQRFGEAAFFFVSDTYGREERTHAQFNMNVCLLLPPLQPPLP